MSDIPEDLRYTEAHLWVNPVDDHALRVGITDRGQKLLSGIANVQLAATGTVVEQGDSCGKVTALFLTNHLPAPVSGVITSTNIDLLDDDPEPIVDHPYGTGWLFEITPSDPSQLNALLTADQYRNLVDENE